MVYGQRASLLSHTNSLDLTSRHLTDFVLALRPAQSSRTTRTRRSPRSARWVLGGRSTSSRANGSTRTTPSGSLATPSGRSRRRVSAHPFLTCENRNASLTARTLRAAPDLFLHLSESDLVVFKGDLNHRKVNLASGDFLSAANEAHLVSRVYSSLSTATFRLQRHSLLRSATLLRSRARLLCSRSVPSSPTSFAAFPRARRKSSTRRSRAGRSLVRSHPSILLASRCNRSLTRICGLAGKYAVVLLSEGRKGEPVVF